MIARPAFAFHHHRVLVVALPAASSAQWQPISAAANRSSARSLGDPLLLQIGNGGYDVSTTRDH